MLDEIGAVFAGNAPGRLSADDVTIYKSLGSIVQDLAAAAYLYRQEAKSLFWNGRDIQLMDDAAASKLTGGN